MCKGILTKDELQLKTLTKEARKEKLKYLSKQKAYEEIEQIPFYLNGPGFTANKTNYLFVYNVETKALLQVNDSQVSVGSFEINKVKNEIIYTASKKLDKRELTNQVYRYNYLVNASEILYSKTDYAIKRLFFLADEIVCYGTDMKKLGVNQNGSFYLIVDNNLELLTHFPTSVGNSIGSDCRLGSSKTNLVAGDKLYFTTTVDDHSEIYSLDKQANLKRLYVADGSIDGLVFINNQFYSIMMHKQKLQELYRLDFQKQKQYQLTRYNSRVLSSYYIAKPKEVIVKFKTHEVKGFVLLPKDYDALNKYPAILNIHGGPKTVYGKIFYHEMQYWANKGYFVFFANPRGSDGKGDEFSDIRGKYGTIDYQDLMAFTDKVLKKYPAIDKQKLFVTGGSYGGFMTNWIIGQTDRFKAAATQRSISNWISFFGTSDIGYYFAKDQTAGHPLKDFDQLWEQSPLKYALKIKTPLLLIHSEEDYRCPMEQALQLYVILKDRGIRSRLVWFKGENHDLSRSGKPQGREKRLTEITNWFGQYR